MEAVLDILKEHGIKAIEDGYITLPKEHCFSIWRIAGKRAEGADGYALYWRVTYEVRICYKDGKTKQDKVKEKLLENAFRELEDLECKYGYNSEDKLDITIYSFTGIEEFD